MEWRPIADNPGYEVSDAGLVRSVARVIEKRNRLGTTVTNSLQGKILSTPMFSNKYLGVVLGRGSKCHLVHRLVARAFCEGYSENLDVNHKNGVRGDNRAENLEWVTRGDNPRHSHRVLGRKRHALAKPVVVKGSGFVMRFNHQSELARLLNVRPGSVASALINNHKVKGCEVAYA